MKRNLFIISSLLLFVLFLFGCKGEETTSKGKSKSIEVSIEDGKFILPTNSGGYDPESDMGTIILDINIKNKMKQSIDIFPESNMVLYDEDQQIDAKSIFDGALDLDMMTNTSVGSDKQKVFPVAFEVEKDKVYELEITPLAIEEDIAPATVSVDMNEFSNSYDMLNEPEEIVEAYIKTVYFNEENKEDLEELLNVDLEEHIDDAKKGFVKLLENMSYADVPDKAASKYYDDYINALKDKAEFDVSLKGNSGEKAIVEVNYSAFSYIDLGDLFSEHRKEYLDKSSTYDSDAADEHAFSKLNLIFKDAKAKESRHPIEIHLKKQDDQWEFIEHFEDPVQKLREIFAEGYNF